VTPKEFVGVDADLGVISEQGAADRDPLIALLATRQRL
jgi:hypothetical protein